MVINASIFLSNKHKQATSKNKFYLNMFMTFIKNKIFFILTRLGGGHEHSLQIDIHHNQQSCARHFIKVVSFNTSVPPTINLEVTLWHSFYWWRKLRSLSCKVKQQQQQKQDGNPVLSEYTAHFYSNWTSWLLNMALNCMDPLIYGFFFP